MIAKGNKKMVFTLTKEEHEIMKALAKAEGLSLSELSSKWLDEFIIEFTLLKPNKKKPATLKDIDTKEKDKRIVYFKDNIYLIIGDNIYRVDNLTYIQSLDN